MTWMQWLQDWYHALHSLGWTCRNQGINEDRVRLTEEELSHLDALYMQKGATVAYLYPSRETVPQRGIICDGWVNCIKPITRVIRIVRGRRPDPQRADVRLENGTATKIIPDIPTPNIPNFDSEPFLVDFDRGLFTPTGRGDWQLTQDEESKALYASYLKASPHFSSFRKYQVAPKPLSPLDTLMGCGANLVGREWKPRNRLI